MNIMGRSVDVAQFDMHRAVEDVVWPAQFSLRVQQPHAPDDEHEGVECPACAKFHFINRRTGKLLGQDEP
jgi:hypothetical protein